MSALMRLRRAGTVYFALATASAASALAIAFVFDLGLAATSVVLLPTLPALYLAWAAFREDRGDAAKTLTAPEALEELAAAVTRQWEAEVRLRRLNDPYPLPVAWLPAASHLFDDWRSIELTAHSWPRRPSSSPNMWATGPNELAGAGNDLASTLEKVPSGRLVVLGAPGPVASWDPQREGFHEWLEGRLALDHPWLREPFNADRDSRSRASILIDRQLVVPLLDGLDELPAMVQAAAIVGINESLRTSEGIIISSRTTEYGMAAQPISRPHVTIRGAAAIELCDLDTDAVRQYLWHSSGIPATANQWWPVFRMLDTDSPVGRALRRPLMANLARVVYSPLADTLKSNVRFPAELLDSRRFTSQTAVESHLLSAFVPAAYRLAGRSTGSKRFANSAQRWLAFLARHLESDRRGAVDLCWWRLNSSLPRWVMALAGAFLGACLCSIVVIMSYASAAIFNVEVLSPVVIATACVGCSALGVAASFSADRMPRKAMLWSRREGVRGLFLGAVVGLQGALTSGIYLFSVIGVNFALLFSLLQFLVTSIASGLVLGVRAAPANLAEINSPITALRRDRKTFLLLATTVGVAALFAVGLAIFLVAGLNDLPPKMRQAGSPNLVEIYDANEVSVNAGRAFQGGTVAVIVACIAGVAAGLTRSAWGIYLLACTVLALTRKLPWKLMDFLADAHEKRSVLRQSGAVYQFRHVELQRNLASRGTLPTTTSHRRNWKSSR